MLCPRVSIDATAAAADDDADGIAVSCVMPFVARKVCGVECNDGAVGSNRAKLTAADG
jgi:hypothetical protein